MKKSDNPPAWRFAEHRGHAWLDTGILGNSYTDYYCQTCGQTYRLDSRDEQEPVRLILIVEPCSQGWLARVGSANVPVDTLPKGYRSCFALAPYREASISVITGQLRGMGFDGIIEA